MQNHYLYLDKFVHRAAAVKQFAEYFVEVGNDPCSVCSKSSSSQGLPRSL